MSLNVTVPAYGYFFSYVAEASYESSIIDSSAISYHNAIPDYAIFTEMDILADYYPLAKPWVSTCF